MKHLAVVGLVLCVCLGPGAGAAAAKTKNIPCKVTLSNPAPGVYQGRVATTKGDQKIERYCRNNRRVNVWHDDGDGVVEPEDDFEIGEAYTDEDGRWTLVGNQAPSGDQIIAEVAPKKKNGLRCKPTRATAQAGQ